VELQFEITRRFEKDLARFSTADQRRVAASIDRSAGSFNPELGDPSGHIYRPHKVLLSQGMDSTLYALRAAPSVRVILAIDDDPLFNRKLVTLLRVVKHDKIDRAFRSMAESLYQHLQMSEERADNG
jgi:mRNA-degrading endonuclease RelE of RelBE toxin-antitoxin system